jgi:hypothetical protein
LSDFDHVDEIRRLVPAPGGGSGGLRTFAKTGSNGEVAPKADVGIVARVRIPEARPSPVAGGLVLRLLDAMRASVLEPRLYSSGLIIIDF